MSMGDACWATIGSDFICALSQGCGSIVWRGGTVSPRGEAGSSAVGLGLCSPLCVVACGCWHVSNFFLCICDCFVHLFPVDRLLLMLCSTEKPWLEILP